MTLRPIQQAGIQGVTYCELQRTWPVQSGRCLCHRHISQYLKFRGILKIIGWRLYHPWSYQSQHAYSC